MMLYVGNVGVIVNKLFLRNSIGDLTFCVKCKAISLYDDEVKGLALNQREEIDEFKRIIVEIDGRSEELRPEKEMQMEEDLRTARKRREKGWAVVHKTLKKHRKPGGPNKGLSNLFRL